MATKLGGWSTIKGGGHSPLRPRPKTATEMLSVGKCGDLLYGKLYDR